MMSHNSFRIDGVLLIMNYLYMLYFLLVHKVTSK